MNVINKSIFLFQIGSFSLNVLDEIYAVPFNFIEYSKMRISLVMMVTVLICTYIFRLVMKSYPGHIVGLSVTLSDATITLCYSIYTPWRIPAIPR